MRDQLCEYVRLLFAGTPDSEDIQQEILQNTLDRYDDLIEQGKSPEAAYRLAIAGIGDINEILDSTPSPDPAPDPQSQPESPQAPAPVSPKKKWLRAIAIALYICCAIPVIALGNFGDGILGVCVMFLMIAAATFMLIFTHGDEEKEKPVDPKEKKEKSIWSTVILVIYLALSFATQAWHITWLIFPIASVIQRAVLTWKNKENRNSFLRIIPHAILIIVLVIILVVGLGIPGLSAHLGNPDGTIVEDQVTLSASQIKNLEIDWVAGNVYILAGDTDHITISVAGNENNNHKTTYEVDDDTLQLCFSNRFLNFGNWSDSEKDLMVTVPADWFCQELEIDGASVNVQIKELQLGSLDLDGASNTVSFTGSVADVDIDGISCEVVLTLPKDHGFQLDMDGLNSTLLTTLPCTLEDGEYYYGNQRCKITTDGISCTITIIEGQ